MEGPVDCVCREEVVVVQVLDEKKTGKAPQPSDVSLELIAACGGVGLHVMAEMYQRILDEIGMPAQWDLSTVVPIFKQKIDVRNCICSRALKLLEHGVKVMERVL